MRTIDTRPEGFPEPPNTDDDFIKQMVTFSRGVGAGALTTKAVHQNGQLPSGFDASNIGF